MRHIDMFRFAMYIVYTLCIGKNRYLLDINNCSQQTNIKL